MPFVHIRIDGREIAQAEVQHLQREATQLLARIMHKKADLTAVLVERMESGAWSIGGRIVPAAGHLDVKVTAGTNTPEEKAGFIAAAHGLLKEVLGADLPVATYDWTLWCEKTGVSLEDISFSHAFDTDDAGLLACVAGLGMVLAPPFLTIREIRSGALTALPGYEPAEIGTYRYLRRSESKMVRQFCSWLHAEMRSLE